MNLINEPLQAIPSNIITGFLGVGKTTAILSLLKRKPPDENWAVLVNEFGEVGIDGELIGGQHAESGGVYIREVPGGCICCAAGLPMQIALNQLLTQAKPQRLLIEPTGLGHPKEVLQVLSETHYRSVLDIQKTITLVDARKITDPRYTSHDTFNQQIDIADIVVGNKSDLYGAEDKAKLKNYLAERKLHETRLHFTDHGLLDPELLKGSSVVATALNHAAKHHHHDNHGANIETPEIPASGYLKVENSGEGFNSIGWRFSPEKVFNRRALFTWFNGLYVERMKAVFITEDGVFGYNLVDETLTEIELDDCFESRVEFISQNIDASWESRLMGCLA